jgi:hypothetical protein
LAATRAGPKALPFRDLRRETRGADGQLLLWQQWQRGRAVPCWIASRSC